MDRGGVIVNCSICEKEVTSVVKPNGVEELHCEACLKTLQKNRKKGCLVRASFQKLPSEKITALKNLSEEQLIKKQQRIAACSLHCVHCEKRLTVEDDWQACPF
jgi:hypothetical protein